MELRKVVICSKCGKPIAFGETFGFVRFKIPGGKGISSSIAVFAPEIVGNVT